MENIDAKAPGSGEIRDALIIGASGGIGSALSKSLTNAGANVTALSRREGGFDLCKEESIAKAAKTLQERGAEFDLIFIATGILAPPGLRPEKSFAEMKSDQAAQIFAVNTIGPALCIKYFAPLLQKKERSVLAALSARVGSIGDNRLGGWMSYRASKTALNQIIRCAALELKRTNKQAIIAALHPGTVPTPLSEPFAKGRFTATPDETANRLLHVLANLTPDQSGGFFAYDSEAIEW